MTTPAPPANGDTVALRGLTSTTLLRVREVKNFIWSPFYAAYVSQGYAEIYTGQSGGAAPAAFYVKSVNGTRPNADGNVTVAGGGVTNPAVAALVATAGETRTAVDARVGSVGDGRYVPLWQASTAYVAGQVVTANGVAISRNADGTSRANYDATEQALWTRVTAPASGAGSPDAALTTATGRAIAFAVALG